MSTREAADLQRALAGSVVRQDRYGSIETVAGVDVAYGRRGGPASAAVVVYRLSDLSPIEEARVTLPVSFPYVPGLLTFREAPAALAALASLSRLPDLLLCDGQGLAHPRRIGFASHLGLYLGLPSVGVAKSRLIGEHADPGPRPGDWTPLVDRGEVIGAVLRTRAGTRPLYISIGNRVSLEGAIAFVRACGKGFRLPEPCRHADRLSKAAPPPRAQE
ncbi:MAG: deoxyribonuclease V [Rhodospirillales bacterium]